MKTRPLGELARVVRSKVAGHTRLTFDIIFDDRQLFEHVKGTGVISRELFATLYRVSDQEVTDFTVFDAGCAFKATIIRPLRNEVEGIGESDVFGSNQHIPLLMVEIPMPEET
jgi:hypothetical protein